jgi:hypothetical protein
MTIPWSHRPKTRKDLLVDILIEVPALYEDIDNINLQTIETRELQHRDIHGRVLAVIAKLEDWNLQFGIALTCAGKDWRYPDRAPTDKFADAHITTLYWACSLVLYSAYKQTKTILISSTSIPKIVAAA